MDPVDPDGLRRRWHLHHFKRKRRRPGSADEVHTVWGVGHAMQPILRSIVVLAAGLAAFVVLPQNALAQPLPPGHPMFVGYGGTFNRLTGTSLYSEVAPISSIFALAPCQFATSGSDPAGSGCNRAAFEALLAAEFSGVNSARRIFLMVGEPTCYASIVNSLGVPIWDWTLNALMQPKASGGGTYWDNVDLVEILHEPDGASGCSLPGVNDKALLWASKVSARSLPAKKIGMTYHQGQLTASSSANAPGIWSPYLNSIGIEAYVNPPGGTDAANKSALDAYLNGAKSQLATAAKSVYVWGQAYDRAGAWTNEETLGTLQDHIWNNIARDTNVLGLIHFSWWRGRYAEGDDLGGSRQRPHLYARHQGIHAVASGLTGSGEIPDYVGVDGLADIADFEKSGGGFWIRQNTGAGGGGLSFQTPGTNAGYGTALNFPAVTKAGWSVLAADFTGDGRADYADVAPKSSQQFGVWIHAANTDGTFSGATWRAVTIGDSTPNLAVQPRELIPSDIDGDGDADLVLHTQTTGVFTVYRNDPGGFTKLQDRVVRPSSIRTNDWRVVVADFNGDGLGDYADMWLSPSLYGHFWVHLGYGDGTFNSATWVEGGASPGLDWATVIGDFTGDGKADFADLSLVSGYFWVHAATTDGQGFPTFSSTNWGYGQQWITGTTWVPLGQQFR